MEDNVLGGYEVIDGIGYSSFLENIEIAKKEIISMKIRRKGYVVWIRRKTSVNNLQKRF